MTGLLVDARDDRGERVLMLTGDIDLATAGDVIAAWLWEASSSQADLVAVDLAQVLFIDAAGLGSLVALRQIAGTMRRSFVVRNPSAQALRIMRICGLDGLLEVWPNVT